MSEALRLHQTRIKPEWIDEYGHMNVAHYITVCDAATWAFWTLVNGGREMDRREGHEYVVLENHVHYLNEVTLDEPVHVTTQLLGHDDKRFILFHHMYKSEDGSLSATNEVKVLGFNLNERRIESFAPDVRERLAATLAAHASLGRPEQAGHGIELKKKA